MQRGRYLHLTALVGALTLAAGVASATALSPPVGIFTADTGLTNGTHVGAGTTTVTGTGTDAVYTINATGFDITGSKDSGYFIYTTLPGDGGITARVLAQSGGSADGWMKDGVMLRDTTDPASAMATINYDGPGKANTSPEVESLIRAKANGSPSFFAPNRDLKNGAVWLRVQRQGTTVQTLSSDNGQDWKLVDSQTMSIKANQPILVGLDSDSHSDTLPTTGFFDNVSIDSNITQSNFLAGPAVVEAVPGDSAVLLTYGAAPNAAGYNIYRQVAGSKDAPVLLTAKPNPYGWFIDTGLTNGTTYIYSVNTVTHSLANPAQLLEGSSATQVLAQPQVPIAPGFRSMDITTMTPGSTTLANGVLTITASGADVTGTGPDGFRFVAMAVEGDYSISAKLLEKPSQGPKNTETWVKAGVMIRESLDPRAAAGWCVATTGQGVHFEHRATYTAASVNDAGTTAAASTFPVWLRMTKSGDNVSAFQSSDGTTYAQIGKAVTFTGLSAAPFTYAGLMVTAHKDTTLVMAKFDAASVVLR